MNSNQDNDLNGKKLKKKIIFEYVYIVAFFILSSLLLPILFYMMVGDNTGIDGIGPAFASAILLRLIRYAFVIVFFVINPIRILITFKNHIKEIFPKRKKIITIIITAFPLLIAFLILFETYISDFIYKLKYETNFNSYVVTAENYKTPSEFVNELKKRGLYYDNNSAVLLNKLNEKYKNEPGFNSTPKRNQYGDIINLKVYYYTEASLMTIEQPSFYDQIDYDNLITSSSTKKAPVYIYNAILTLPEEGGKLQYAPIGRYDMKTYLTGRNYPYFQDYYIECKILYVDGNIYALIGLGECYDVEKYFDDNKDSEKSVFDFNNPYHMILSETGSVTTFLDGTYYPNAGIENHATYFQMQPNSNASKYSYYFPIKKIDNLNITTLNNVAQELQNGILKNSIEYHFNNNKLEN